jgi:hypothetical protein
LLFSGSGSSAYDIGDFSSAPQYCIGEKQQQLEADHATNLNKDYVP